MSKATITMADTEGKSPPNKINHLARLQTPKATTENIGSFPEVSKAGRTPEVERPADVGASNGANDAAGEHVSDPQHSALRAASQSPRCGVCVAFELRLATTEGVAGWCRAHERRVDIGSSCPAFQGFADEGATAGGDDAAMTELHDPEPRTDEDFARAWHEATLAAALEYAEHGVPVFPCNRKKRPLVKTGFKAASTNPAHIRAWWRSWPHALIGIPTGAASGWLVLDIDSKNGVNGFESLPNWREMTDVIVRTPSGGAHLYFAFDTVRPMGSSAGKFAPGVDIRGEGGYVIAPPSRPDMARPEYRIEDGCDDLVRSGGARG